MAYWLYTVVCRKYNSESRMDNSSEKTHFKRPVTFKKLAGVRWKIGTYYLDSNVSWTYISETAVNQRPC